MSKELNYEEWQEKYYNNRNIDIMKYINKEDIELIKKLNIDIEEKIYTEHELELLEMAILQYYKEKGMSKEDMEFTKTLEGTGVTRKEYNKVLEKLEVAFQLI